jgi:hypothetical protein
MMGQMKIELAKNTYFPREVVKGTLKLSIEKPLAPNLVKLEIIGLEKTFIQSARKRSAFTYSENNYIIKDVVPLEIPENLDKELTPGEHDIYFQYRIPQYALPTYSGSHVSITYNMNANVEAEDFLTLNCTIPVLVQRVKKVPHSLKEPSHFKSQNYFDPDDLNPGLYVELAQTGYLAGEDLWGYITLKNMAALRLKNIVLELKGEEYAYAQKHHKTTVIHRIKKEFPTRDIKEGMPIQFTLPTSKDLPGGFEGMFSSLKWTFEARLDISSMFKVKAKSPVEILG